MISLSGTYILRPLRNESQVSTELPFFHFRIRFGYFQFIGSSVTGKVGRKSGKYTLHIMLVYLCLYFEVRSNNLADMFSCGNGLSDLRIQVSYLSVNRSFNLQVFQALTDQRKTAFHVAYVLVQTADLAFTENIILTDTFVNDRQLFFGSFILLLCLTKILAGNQLLLHQTSVLFITAFFQCKFFIQAYAFLFQLQTLLLHTDAGIAQFIFLIGKVCLTLHDSDIQQRVAETQNHIARFHHSSFFFQTFFHTTAFYGIHIDNPAGHHLPDHTDIIIELRLLDGSNRETVFLNCHGGSRISKNKI